MIINPYSVTTSSSPVYWYDTLFLNGDLGLVADFNDLSTLFKDTAHTIPCTAAGDQVKSVLLKKAGVWMICRAGSPVLAYSSAHGKFYCQIDAATDFSASGTLPSGLISGSQDYTFIEACGYTSGQNFCPAYIGPDYPTNPAGGNAITLLQIPDPSSTLDWIQFGASNAVQGGNQSTLDVYIGVKSTYSTGYRPDARIYRGGSLIASSTFNVGNAISDPSFNMGRVLGAGPIYSVVIVNRAITSSEIAMASGSAL